MNFLFELFNIGFLSNQTSDENENLNQRANVIKEIYKTESDYLGHLKNLVDVSEI